MKPIRLNDRIHLIDGFDLGVAERTGTYVIDEEELTIVESGPSPSVKHVKKGLETLGFSLDQVKYIIVTHIHLNHAGGVGLLLQDCPNARVVVHPKGARHWTLQAMQTIISAYMIQSVMGYLPGTRSVWLFSKWRSGLQFLWKRPKQLQWKKEGTTCFPKGCYVV